MTSTQLLNIRAAAQRASIDSMIRSRVRGSPPPRGGATACAPRAGLRAGIARRSASNIARQASATLARRLMLALASLVALSAVAHRVHAQTISVFPDGQAVGQPTSSTVQTANFGLVNLVSGQTYFREIFCTGEVINCGSTTPQQFTAPKTSISVTYFTTNTGGPGRIFLKVYKAGMTPMDTGWFNVTVTPTDLVSDLTANNNTNQDPGLCEASCFTPIYSQGTVPYHTLGAARNITLVYHGDRAAPTALIYSNVSISTSRTVSEFWLQATRPNGANITFSNGDTLLRFAGTNAGQVRLGGQVNLDANGIAGTGMTQVSMLVTAKFTDGTTQRQRFAPQVMVLDQRGSSIARGWAIAGLQRLYKQSDGNVLVTDGSGGASHFAVDPNCSTCFKNSGGDISTLTKGATSWTRNYADSTKAQFDTTGKLTSITDAFGNQTAFAYDGSGRLAEVQDPILTYSGGRKAIVLTYGTYGLATVQNPSTAANTKSAGRTTYFTVAPDSTLSAIKDPDGDSTRFTYDGSRRLQRVINRRGDTTTYTLDTNGRLQYVDLPRVQLYNGLASPRQQYVDSRMSGVPTGATSVTAWTPALVSSLADTVGDALGNKTSFTVNPWGQPLRITDALGQTTLISRTGIYPTTVQYPGGAIDSSTFSNGLLTSQRLAGANRVNIHYGVWGQPDSVGGLGRPSMRNSFGPGGRVDWTRIGPSDSLRVSYSYDARGRVLTQTDSMAHVTRFTYDAITGNPDSTISPGNRFTKIGYDAYGRVITQQSNNEPLRRVVYDSVDRVREVYDSVNATPTRYTYDQLFLVRVQDAKGQVYRMDKNALGWTTRRYDPADTLNRYDSYTYEPSGKLHSWTNRRGQQINYAYDTFGRLVSKSGTNTSTDSLAYSADGKIAVMWNAVQRDSVISDSTGWVKSIITRLSGQRFQIDYRPSSIQQIDSVLISGGGITFAARHYGWNSTTGTLDTISVNGATTSFVRNKDLLPTQTFWPSLTRTEDWTAIHTVSKSTFSVPNVDTAFSRRYSYDSRSGMQDYITQDGSNYRTRQRTYDGLRRLAGLGDDVYAPASCGSDPVSGYLCPVSTQSTVTYDMVGNRADAPDTMYTIGNRMTRFNGYTYAYDLDGNDTSKVNVATGDRKSYEWSADGLLNRVLVNGVEKVRFDYNVAGQLVRRYTNGTLDRVYLWERGQLLAELNATATQRLGEYAYSPGADFPFAIITGATSITATRYHLIDEVGNVIAVLNGSTIDERISYDDWGIATTTGNTDNRLMFKGLLWEPDAGLYYMRARWYDPQNGRFISEDPIGLRGGPNVYTFAENDPVNASDPSGQWKLKNFLKSVLQVAPVIAFAALAATPTVGLFAATKALTATAIGSAAAAGVEHVATGARFGDAFQRNFGLSSLGLVGGIAFGGKILSAGANGPLQGYVQSSKHFGAVTFGSAAVFDEAGPSGFIVQSVLGQLTYGQHELGHTIQFIGMSAFHGVAGLGPWIPYGLLGAAGYLGQLSNVHGVIPVAGCAWEGLASIFGGGSAVAACPGYH